MKHEGCDGRVAKRGGREGLERLKLPNILQGYINIESLHGRLFLADKAECRL